MIKKSLLISCMLLAIGCGKIDRENRHDDKTQGESKSIKTMRDLQTFVEDSIKKGVLPEKLLVREHHAAPMIKKSLHYDIENVVTWDFEKETKCKNHLENIIIANDTKNKAIHCAFEDTIVLTGDGDDWVDLSYGTNLIYLGKGDDYYEHSYGTQVLVFEKNWGHDYLNLSNYTMTPDANDTEYRWKYNSFLLFGEGIKKKAMYWDGNKLINNDTNDSIIMTHKNINLVFLDDNSSDEINQTNPDKIYDKYIQNTALSDEQIQHKFYYAATENKIEELKEMINLGAKPNFEGHQHESALEMAARLNRTKSVKVLLENGANPDFKNYGPIISASIGEADASLKLLIEHGAQINPQDVSKQHHTTCSPLHSVVGHGDIEMVQYMLEHGADKHATCRDKEEKPEDWLQWIDWEGKDDKSEQIKALLR